jgi:hypothetical protein
MRHAVDPGSEGLGKGEFLAQLRQPLCASLVAVVLDMGVEREYLARLVWFVPPDQYVPFEVARVAGEQAVARSSPRTAAD